MGMSDVKKPKYKICIQEKVKFKENPSSTHIRNKERLLESVWQLELEREVK